MVNYWGNRCSFSKIVIINKNKHLIKPKIFDIDKNQNTQIFIEAS